MPVAGAVEEALGVMVLAGTVQLAKTDKNKSQQISFTFCWLQNGRVGIIDGMESNQAIQE